MPSQILPQDLLLIIDSEHLDAGPADQKQAIG
jgi:hypothetical protein